MVVNENNPKIWASLIAPNPKDVAYWVDLTADPHGNIIKFYNNNDKQWYNLTAPTSEDVVVTKSDVGLGLVENIAPADMPVSTATQTALNFKAGTSRTITAGAGLTGGGDLTTDRTFNVASATDGILVNTDSIQLNVVDALDSTSATRPLSANQGSLLNTAVSQLRAEFFGVLIQTSKHVGGELIVSPANMICNKVEELGGHYRCYFDRGENNESNNEFVVGDQARCNVFTGSGQKYYWRLVTSIGLDYIDLSKTDCDIDSDAPAIGDNIFQLGHRTDTERQNAQIISSYGPNSPSYIQYGGINSFSLVGKSLTKFTGKGNEIFGKLHIEAGSTGWTNIDGLPEEFMAANEYAQGLINGISLGTVNLLRNTAFTGDYVSKDLSATDELAASDQLYSEPLKYWTSYGSNVVFVELDSTSGFGVSINGTLGQTTPKLVAGESYMMSFKAKGYGSLVVGLGSNSISVTLAEAYSEFVLKFVPTETKTYDFYFQGIASIYEPQLERGTIASKWSYSPVDAHKSEERFQAIKYITSAIIDGSVDVIGGLILCNMLQLGNYKDGVLEKVTSGLSGLYNDDDDPAFWAGGTLEDAIRVIMNPDDTSGANAVITHGGRAIFNDAIIRGIIYATGGMFRGRIESNMDGSRIIIDPETRDIKMIDTLGREVASYGFYQVEGQSGPKVTLKAYDGETTTVLASSVLFAGRLTVYDGDVNIVNFVADLGSKSIQLNPDKIPNAGTYVGDLYKDGNTLKIKIS